jgi:hypothetical protein
MDAPGTITAAQFASLARGHMHSMLEATRARRAPDPVQTTGGEITAPLDAALANQIAEFIMAAEHVPPSDDEAAIHAGILLRHSGEGRGGPSLVL